MIKYIVYCWCFFASWGYSQKKEPLFSSMDVNYFKGNIALHSENILHLIKGHPEGVIISWSKKTYGNLKWEHYYNYPDYGVSISYQNLKNPVLGNTFGAYAHYSFYFLNRHLMFRFGQGLSLTTNPYDKITNHKNTAFGSTIMSGTYVLLNFKKENIIPNFGIQAGVTLTHSSNGNIKAPNTSVNTIAANLGVTYSFENKTPLERPQLLNVPFKETLKYNIIFRSGINQSDVVGSKQFPFYIVSAYADKRLCYKSALQLGVDAFLSKFLKEHIRYNAIAFPNRGEDGQADYKRIGVFIGHELFINKLSVISQLGYYAYYPYDFEGRNYFRIGLKYYFKGNWFGAISLKSHAAKAEAAEFGLGVRL